jgi:SAM-dependent methyltransferase
MTYPTSSEAAHAPLSARIDGCRSCGSTRLREALDLGATPLANALLPEERVGELEPRFPLVLAFCEECALVQITETVSPEVLFSHYVYASSFSDTMLRHAEELCERLVEERRLGPRSLVAEIASNDGYLLQYFVRAGVPVLGIEPARNIARIAAERGVRTLNEFFSLELARRLRSEGVGADVVLGNNVLAHAADLNGFVEGAALLLEPGGIVRFEFPYLGDLLAKLEFDTIYHEHLCYFSAHAIDALFARHGLVFADVERLAIHGGSLRVTGAREATGAGTARVRALLDEERARKLDTFDALERFGADVRALTARLKEMLQALRRDGKRVVAYGASAKGSTLLNYMAPEPGLIDYVVDRSSLKQGLFTPGTHLRIHGPDRLVEDRPDYALLLTWNFASEILEQQRAYRAAGGKFIVPLPELTIL